MTEAKRNGEELPEETRINPIKRELTLTQLMRIDPDFYSRYIRLQSFPDYPGDPTKDIMEGALARRVNELREEGQIDSIQEIERQAENMVDMTPDQIKKIFSLTRVLSCIIVAKQMS